MQSIDVGEDEFHVLSLCNTIFYIDRDVRREVERLMRDATSPYANITVTDLAGSEVMVIVDSVNAMWSTSPDQRARDRAMRRILEAEEPPA